MSAFRCSNRHTAVISMLAHAPGIVDSAQIQETARVLRTLNDAALFARYGDSPAPISSAEMVSAIRSGIDWMRTANPADMLAIAKCFAYQCAEDIPADYPGLAILADVITRLSAMRSATAFKSEIWSI